MTNAEQQATKLTRESGYYLESGYVKASISYLERNEKKYIIPLCFEGTRTEELTWGIDKKGRFVLFV